MIEIALFEPDIPQNVGNILRTADCFGIKVNIIEPCGFIFGGKYLKRSAMDYLETVEYQLHEDFEAFLEYVKDKEKRIILATTKGSQDYTTFSFQKDDILLFGKETKGVPEEVHNSSYARVKINMKEGKRSLNLAVSVAIILTESLRQLKV